MIKPTIGRVLWYYTNPPLDQPYAVLVAYVWNDTMVNVGGFDANGKPFAETSVLLWDGEGPTPQQDHCTWMPFQKGQAAKTEALEAQVKRKPTISELEAILKEGTRKVTINPDGTVTE